MSGVRGVAARGATLLDRDKTGFSGRLRLDGWTQILDSRNEVRSQTRLEFDETLKFIGIKTKRMTRSLRFKPISGALLWYASSSDT